MHAPPPYMQGHPYGSAQPPMPTGPIPAELGVRQREWDMQRDANSERDKKRPRAANNPNAMPFTPSMNVNLNMASAGNNNNTSNITNNTDINTSRNDQSKNNNAINSGNGVDNMNNRLNHNNNNNSGNNMVGNNVAGNNSATGNVQFAPQMQGKGPPPNFQPVHSMHQPPGMPFHNHPNMGAPHPGMSMPPHAYPPYMTKGPPFTRPGMQVPPGMGPAGSGAPAPPAGSSGSIGMPDRGGRGSKNVSTDDPHGSGNLSRASGKNGPGNREPESFKEFLAKQPDSISPQDAKESYDRYVREFPKTNGNSKSLNTSDKKPNTFFESHKDEEWFKERYDPDYVHSRCSRVRKECQDRARDFHKLWKLGGSAVCAPDISAKSLGKEAPVIQVENPDYILETKEDLKKEDVPSETGKEVKKEAEDEQGEEPVQSNDSTPTNVEKAASSTPEKVKAEKDGAGEEAALQKIKGENDESIESEKADPKDAETEEPKNTKNEIKKDEEGTEQDEGKKEEEGKVKTLEERDEGGKERNPSKTPDDKKQDLKGLRGKGRRFKGKKMLSLVLPLKREHEKNTIFLRGIPINLKRDDLASVLAHGRRGDLELDLRRVKIGDINPHRHLQRFAWAVYADEDSASRALGLVRGVRVRSRRTKSCSGGPIGDERGGIIDSTSEYTIDCMLNLERKKKYSHGRVLPEVFGTADRMKIDVEQSVEVMRFLDNLRQIDSDCNVLTDEFIAGLPDDASRLNHIVTYLRETHYYCYYSGNEFLEDATSMPPQELRPVVSEERKMSDTDMRMAKRVDDRTKWVLERDYDRPRSDSDRAEEARKKAVDDWISANTVNEGENRYRCSLPPHKLFKAPEFVHKHLKSKHGDKMRQIMNEVAQKIYRANFENDPSKDEVISIYNEGAMNNDRGSGGRSGPRGNGNHGSNGNANGGMNGGMGMGPGMGSANGMMGMGPNSGNSSGGSFTAPPSGLNPMGGPVRPGMPVGMFNPATAYMGLGMQPMPMMMMPQAGFSYPNSMPFGRGMGGPSMGGPPPSAHGHTHGPPPHMQNMGGKGDMWQRPGNMGANMGGMKDGFGPPQMGRQGGGGGMGGNNNNGGGGGRGGGLRDPKGSGGEGGGGGLRGNNSQGSYHGGRRGGGGQGGRRGGGRSDRDGGEPLDPRAMGPRRNYTDLDAPAKGPSFDLVRYDDV